MELPVYNNSATYSCLTQLPNGNIGLLYEADKYNRIEKISDRQGEKYKEQLVSVLE